MLNKILQISSETGIISNFTLCFENKTIANEYNLGRYNFIKYLIVTVINVCMAVVVTILSSISYFSPPTIFMGVHIFLAYLTFGIISLGLVFLLLGMRRNKFMIVMTFVLSSMHLINFTIMAYLLRMIILNHYHLSSDISEYRWMIDVTWILEGHLQVFYLLFIQNSFGVHLCSYFSTCLFLIIVELFLAQSREYLAISMYSFVNATLAVILCYIHEKRDKLNFYYLWKYSLLSKLSEGFINSEKCYSCSFMDNSIFYVNDTLKHKLKTLAKHSGMEIDLEKLFTNNLFNNKLQAEPLHKNEIEEISTVAKKICLTGFTSFNDNLPLLLKDYLNPMKAQLSKELLVERCKCLFSYLRDNKDTFEKYHHIGTKEDHFTGKPYYSFLRVNSDQSVEFLAFEIEDSPAKEIENTSFEQIAMFSSKVTHEIKNPLIAVQTLIHNIKEIIASLVPKDILNSLDKIVDYANYMMIITKDFECFAKMMSCGGGENEQKYLVADLNYQTVKFRELVNFCISLVQSAKMREMSKVEISKDIDEAICNTIVTDELRLKQVLINLLSNSLKFTKIGKITVACEDENEDFIKISVIDTGIGIKEDDLKKLLDPRCKFVKSNTSTNQFGAGLGLCIVKEIVSKIGKNLEIKSKYREGTSISFLLKKNNSGEKSTIPNLEKASIENSEVIDGNLNNTATKLVQIGTLENYGQTQDNLFKEQITKREDFQPKKVNIFDNIRNCHKRISEAQRSLTREIISQASTFFEVTGSKCPNRKSYMSKYTHVDSHPLENRMSLDPSPIKLGTTVISNESDIQQQSGMGSISPKNNNEIIVKISERSRKTRRKISVIVVDDDSMMRNSTCNVIKKYCRENQIDVNIEECGDGIDCIYRIYKGHKDGEKYSIIITDESMDFLCGSFMSYIIKTLILNQAFYPINIYLSSCYSGKPSLKYNGIQIFEDVLQKPLEPHDAESIFNNEVNII